MKIVQGATSWNAIVLIPPYTSLSRSDLLGLWQLRFLIFYSLSSKSRMCFFFFNASSHSTGIASMPR